jgi:methyltransferase (TIGR00027 family)
MSQTTDGVRAGHEQWDVSGVGVTALGVALCREMENARPDAIVHDPYAQNFLTTRELPESYRKMLPEIGAPADQVAPLWPSMSTYMAVRTRFFDAFFSNVAATGVRQVVIVAAGLDTRAYRLDWPAGTVVFELDQPRVLGFKDEVLGEAGAVARCDRRAVAADLRDDWPALLRESGFDPAQPTAWLVEGLLFYLPAAAEAALFGAIRKLSAPGSRLAIETVAGNQRDQVLGSNFAAEAIGTPFEVSPALWQTELRPEPVDVLDRQGWSVIVDRVVDVAERYRRPVPGVMAESALHTMLLTAKLR